MWLGAYIQSSPEFYCTKQRPWDLVKASPECRKLECWQFRDKLATISQNRIIHWLFWDASASSLFWALRVNNLSKIREQELVLNLSDSRARLLTLSHYLLSLYKTLLCAIIQRDTHTCTCTLTRAVGMQGMGTLVLTRVRVKGEVYWTSWKRCWGFGWTLWLSW